MSSKLSQNSHSKVYRHGMSVVEFVGCLVALCGGVAMGSMYLGVDLQGLAEEVLHRSQATDQEVEAEASESTEAQPLEASQESSTDPTQVEEKEVQATEEIDSDQGVAVDDTTETQVQPEAEPQQREELTEKHREEVTRAYWETLTHCVQNELSRRNSGIKNVENWQLLDYLTHRLEGHQEVVDALEELDEHGVDERVTFHAKQVIAWHQAGVNLNQRALDLITDGPKADLTGPVAQSWQSSATQHRMEEKLVQEKHLGVASYLAHTYESFGASSK